MATGLTSQWATGDFLPSQILQAIGQSFALTALLALIVRSINPADALAIGCLLQISRLFGGEIGTAFMQTFVRVREQIHSNLVGLHVDGTAGLTIDRLAAYGAAVGAHTADLGASRRPRGEAAGDHGGAAGVGAVLHRWLHGRGGRRVRLPAAGRAHAPSAAFAVLRPPLGCKSHFARAPAYARATSA